MITKDILEKDFPFATFREVEEKGVFKICTEADSNDGDYVYNTLLCTSEEFTDYLEVMKLILLGKFTSYGDCENNPIELDDKQYDLMCNLLPNSEHVAKYLEISSIEYIDINGKLWEVSL